VLTFWLQAKMSCSPTLFSKSGHSRDNDIFKFIHHPIIEYWALKQTSQIKIWFEKVVKFLRFHLKRLKVQTRSPQILGPQSTKNTSEKNKTRSKETGFTITSLIKSALLESSHCPGFGWPTAQNLPSLIVFVQVTSAGLRPQSVYVMTIVVSRKLCIWRLPAAAIRARDRVL